MEGEKGVRGVPHRRLVEASAPPVPCERPGHEGILRAPEHELSEEALSVPTPQFVPASPTSERASEEARQCDPEREVEPDDGVRTRPGDVHLLTRVVSDQQPLLSANRITHTSAKDLHVGAHPARSPVEGVELDRLQPKAAAELFSDLAIARTGVPDDRDSPAQREVSAALYRSGLVPWNVTSPVPTSIMVIRASPLRPSSNRI